jgi:hypothetical protein
LRFVAHELPLLTEHGNESLHELAGLLFQINRQFADLAFDGVGHGVGDAVLVVLEGGDRAVRLGDLFGDFVRFPRPDRLLREQFQHARILG